MKYLLVLFLFIAQQAVAQKTLDQLLDQNNTRSVPYISVEGLRALQINSDVVLLDTREDSEYKISKIKDATCVGYNNFSIAKISEEITDKSTPIVVYCSLGIRSEEIGEKLTKAGYTNVQNLYGGIFEWKNKGYPIVNPAQKETDSIHTFSKAWSKWLKQGIATYGSQEEGKKQKIKN